MLALSHEAQIEHINGSTIVSAIHSPGVTNNHNNIKSRILNKFKLVRASNCLSLYRLGTTYTEPLFCKNNRCYMQGISSLSYGLVTGTLSTAESRDGASGWGAGGGSEVPLKCLTILILHRTNWYNAMSINTVNIITGHYRCHEIPKTHIRRDLCDKIIIELFLFSKK